VALPLRILCCPSYPEILSHILTYPGTSFWHYGFRGRPTSTGASHNVLTRPIWTSSPPSNIWGFLQYLRVRGPLVTLCVTSVRHPEFLQTPSWLIAPPTPLDQLLPCEGPLVTPVTAYMQTTTTVTASPCVSRQLSLLQRWELQLASTLTLVCHGQFRRGPHTPSQTWAKIVGTSVDNERLCCQGRRGYYL